MGRGNENKTIALRRLVSSCSAGRCAASTTGAVVRGRAHARAACKPVLQREIRTVGSEKNSTWKMLVCCRGQKIPQTHPNRQLLHGRGCPSLLWVSSEALCGCGVREEVEQKRAWGMDKPQKASSQQVQPPPLLANCLSTLCLLPEKPRGFSELHTSASSPSGKSWSSKVKENKSEVGETWSYIIANTLPSEKNNSALPVSFVPVCLRRTKAS